MKKLLAFVQALCVASLALIPTASNAIYSVKDRNYAIHDNDILLDSKYYEMLGRNLDLDGYSDEEIANTVFYCKKGDPSFISALIPYY